MVSNGHAVIVTTSEELDELIIRAVRTGLKEICSAVLPAHREPQRKRLLDSKEAAAEFGIGIRMLERWRAEGIGPAYTTVGRRIFYERSVFENFFAEGRVQTTGRAEE